MEWGDAEEAKAIIEKCQIDKYAGRFMTAKKTKI